MSGFLFHPTLMPGGLVHKHLVGNDSIPLSMTVVVWRARFVNVDKTMTMASSTSLGQHLLYFPFLLHPFSTPTSVNPFSSFPNWFLLIILSSCLVFSNAFFEHTSCLFISSYSFPDNADAFAQHETGLVQTLRRVIEAPAHSAGYGAQYIGYSYFHFYS